jgi:phage terminase large subunit-like protein
MPGLTGIERRIARAEALLGPRVQARGDRSSWDWYAQGCPCGLAAGECRKHPRARAAQRPPAGDWRAWLLLMGRGAGKTRAAAEWVRHQVESRAARRLALVGATTRDVRDTMVEGQSGILAISPPWFKPRYEPSKCRLTWPNGARATTFSAEEPERLRGPEHDGAWLDELAAWRYPAAMSILLLGLRLGDNPRLCVTTTPKPRRLVTDLVSARTTAISRGTTFDNRHHLSRSFYDDITGMFEGTRLGRQELHGEVLEVGDGAWFAQFDPARHVTDAAEYDPRFSAHLAIDCGVSRHTAAVWFQVRGLDPSHRRVTVFGDWHGEGLYSEAAARAIRARSAELPHRGEDSTVRLDPAASARTGIGPAAYGEFERVFGARTTAHWPQHRVADGLDQLELLLDKGFLLIHPRCTRMKAAFQNYTRKRTAQGEWLDEPEDPQHPHEDLMDAIRGGVRDRFPDGRLEQPFHAWVPAARMG